MEAVRCAIFINFPRVRVRVFRPLGARLHQRGYKLRRAHRIINAVCAVRAFPFGDCILNVSRNHCARARTQPGTHESPADARPLYKYIVQMASSHRHGGHSRSSSLVYIKLFVSLRILARSLV